MSALDSEVGTADQAVTEETHRVEADHRRVRVRSFRPAEGICPSIVFLHGGGWVMGSIETHAAACRALAARTGCVVFSVDYRLAPEDPFPAAVDDAYAVLCWVAAQATALSLDPSRLLVAGDSAGGNLAVAVSMIARDRAGPLIDLQILVYPVVSTDFDREFDDAYDGVMLFRDELAWHQDHYLVRPEDRNSPLVSPLGHAELAGLPEALVLVADCDPLHVQGRDLVAALTAAGVGARLEVVRHTVHGFFQFPGRWASADYALELIGEAVRDRSH